MNVSFRNYPTGMAGTKYTIDQMRRMVRKGKMDPNVIALADTAIRGCPQKDYEAEAKAIYDFVKQSVRYTRDPQGVETLQAPLVTMKRGCGDCDCQTILVCALAGACGMPCGFEAIRCSGQYPDQFSHIYPILNTGPRRWSAADTTMASGHFGWRPTAGVYGRKIWMA